MSRFRIELSYEGTCYEGWQSQPSGRTIQDTLEAAIKKITGEDIRIIAAGRTDSGVHALSQVAHFDSDTKIPALNLRQSLNSVLPSDISVLNVSPAPVDFHARKLATAKHYDYLIYNDYVSSPFWRRFSWHLRSPLDIESIRAAAALFLGEHDFTSFCATGTDIIDKKRTITEISITKADNRIVRISVVGTGFLRHMVRIMTGTLAKVGMGRMRPEEIPEIIAAKDRTLAGPTAPASGLFLMKIFY